MPAASQQTHNAPTTHPICISHQWLGMCLWNALWSGGLTLILYCTWLLACPPLVLWDGHAEWSLGQVMMSPEQMPCKKRCFECPTTGQFFALHTILPDHFWRQHLRDPCKGDFILAGMKTNLGASSPLQNYGYRASSPTAQG